MIRITKKLLEAGFPLPKDEKYLIKWEKENHNYLLGFNSVLWHQDIGKWVLENIDSIEYTEKRSI